MLSTFLLKGRIIFKADELDDISVTYLEPLVDKQTNEVQNVMSFESVKEMLDEDWEYIKKQVNQVFLSSNGVTFSHYFQCFGKELRVILKAPDADHVELLFVDNEPETARCHQNFEKMKFFEALSKIDHAILHFRDLEDVTKVVKEELQKFFSWAEIYLDRLFYSAHEESFNNSDDQSLKIVDFDRLKCFRKLKKWKRFFILTPDSKTCQDCQELDCRNRPGIVVPLKYLDDFYGGLVVSFNTDDIYNVEMVDFLQSVAENFSSFWHNYTITHQPSRTKQKIEEYYTRLKERNTELEDKNKELQLLIEENRRAKEQAEESDRLKLAFLGNMSHEIRTPINGIVGFAQLLKNCEISEKASSYVDIVIDSSHNLMKLMDNIIGYSKLQADQVEENKIPSSLNKELNELLFDLISDNDKYKRGVIEVKKEYALEAPADYLLLDIVNLKGILRNLLDNALKFTHEGSIFLGYRLYKNCLLFFLQDTGIGIPDDKKKIIFDHFRQSDESKVRAYGGLGLGLAIVNELIELVGGEIWFESSVDKGTTFYFTFPFTIPEENKTLTLPSEKLESDELKVTGQNHILLIENDPENSQTIKNAMNDHYHVEMLETGSDALIYLNDHTDVDLILLDVRLPDVKGDELIRRIKSDYPGIRIIAQIAENMEKDRQSCFTAGCDDFLIKPVTEREVMHKVAEYK
jgi:signal transduction histidine kinase/CheY-like chemotaxis protein